MTEYFHTPDFSAEKRALLEQDVGLIGTLKEKLLQGFTQVELGQMIGVVRGQFEDLPPVQANYKETLAVFVEWVKSNFPDEMQEQVFMVLRQSGGDLIAATAFLAFPNSDDQSSRVALCTLMSEIGLVAAESADQLPSSLDGGQANLWLSQNFPILFNGSGRESLFNLVLDVTGGLHEIKPNTLFPEDLPFGVLREKFRQRLMEQLEPNLESIDFPDDPSSFISELCYRGPDERRLPRGDDLPTTIIQLLHPEKGVLWNSSPQDRSMLRSILLNLDNNDILPEVISDMLVYAALSPELGLTADHSIYLDRQSKPSPARMFDYFDYDSRGFIQVLTSCPETSRPLLEAFLVEQMQAASKVPEEWEAADESEQRRYIVNLVHLLFLGMHNPSDDYCQKFMNEALFRGSIPWNELGYSPNLLRVLDRGLFDNSRCPLDMTDQEGFSLGSGDDTYVNFYTMKGYESAGTWRYTKEDPFVEQITEIAAAIRYDKTSATQILMVTDFLSYLIGPLNRGSNISSQVKNRAIMQIARNLASFPHDFSVQREFFQGTFYPWHLASQFESIGLKLDGRWATDEEEKKGFSTVHPGIIAESLAKYDQTQERNRAVASQIHAGGDQRYELRASLDTLREDGEYQKWLAEVIRRFDNLSETLRPIEAKPRQSFRQAAPGFDDYFKSGFHLLADRNLRPAEADSLRSAFHFSDIWSRPLFEDLKTSDLRDPKDFEKLVVLAREKIPDNLLELLMLRGADAVEGEAKRAVESIFRFVENTYELRKYKSESLTRLAQNLQTVKQAIVSLKASTSAFDELFQKVYNFAEKRDESIVEIALNALDKIILALSDTSPDQEPISYRLRISDSEQSALRKVIGVLIDLKLLIEMRKTADNYVHQTGESFQAKGVFCLPLIRAKDAIPKVFNPNQDLDTHGVEPANATIDRGGVLVVSGPTGGGKSTYLTAVAGAMATGNFLPQLGNGTVIGFEDLDYLPIREVARVGSQTHVSTGHSLFSSGAREISTTQGFRHTFNDEIFQGAPSSYTIALTSAHIIRCVLNGGTVAIADHKAYDLVEVLELLGFGDQVSTVFIDPSTRRSHEGIGWSFGLSMLELKGVDPVFVQICQELLDASLVNMPPRSLDLSEIVMPASAGLEVVDEETFASAGISTSATQYTNPLEFFTKRTGGNWVVLEVMTNQFREAAKEGMFLGNRVSRYKRVDLEPHREAIRLFNTALPKLSIPPDLNSETLLDRDLRDFGTDGRFRDYSDLVNARSTLRRLSEIDLDSVLSRVLDPGSHTDEEQKRRHAAQVEKLNALKVLLEEAKSFKVSHNYALFAEKKNSFNLYADDTNAFISRLVPDWDRSNPQYEIINDLIKQRQWTEDQARQFYDFIRSAFDNYSGSDPVVDSRAKYSIKGLVAAVAHCEASEWQAYLDQKDDRLSFLRRFDQALADVRTVIADETLPLYWAFSSRSDNQLPGVPFCIPEEGELRAMPSPIQFSGGVNLSVLSDLQELQQEFVPINLFPPENGKFLGIDEMEYLNEPPNVLQYTGMQKGGKSVYVQTALQFELMRRVMGEVPAKSALMAPSPARVVAALEPEFASEGNSSFMEVAETIERVVRQINEGAWVFLDEPGRHTSTSETEAIVAALGFWVKQRGGRLMLTNHEEGADENLGRIAGEGVSFLNLAMPLTDRGSSGFQLEYGHRGGAESIEIAAREGLDSDTVMLAQFIHELRRQLSDHKKRIL